MKAARTASALLGQLDDDLAWRVKEIASVQSAIRSSRGASQSALLRAAVPLLYAHWEGYIKAVAILYVDFISKQGLTYRELNRSFQGIRALSQVKQLHAISKRIFASTLLLNELYQIEDTKASIALSHHISNIGNLSFDMFEQIGEFIAVRTAGYATRKQLIDESLLRQRNEIAHGEYILIDPSSFNDLSVEILGIMRQFKNDVQNAVSLKAYLR